MSPLKSIKNDTISKVSSEELRNTGMESLCQVRKASAGHPVFEGIRKHARPLRPLHPALSQRMWKHTLHLEKESGNQGQVAKLTRWPHLSTRKRTLLPSALPRRPPWIVLVLLHTGVMIAATPMGCLRTSARLSLAEV